MRGVRVPSEKRQHHEEPDHIRDGDVPALAHPRAHRSGFRIEIRDRHARRRSEPDHRSAVAHRERQHTPIVTTRLERELGEGNVVEDCGDEAQTEGGLPARSIPTG